MEFHKLAPQSTKFDEQSRESKLPSHVLMHLPTSRAPFYGLGASRILVGLFTFILLEKESMIELPIIRVSIAPILGILMNRLV